MPWLPLQAAVAFPLITQPAWGYVTSSEWSPNGAALLVTFSQGGVAVYSASNGALLCATVFPNLSAGGHSCCWMRLFCCCSLCCDSCAGVPATAGWLLYASDADRVGPSELRLGVGLSTGEVNVHSLNPASRDAPFPVVAALPRRHSKLTGCPGAGRRVLPLAPCSPLSIHSSLCVRVQPCSSSA